MYSLWLTNKPVSCSYLICRDNSSETRILNRVIRRRVYSLRFSISGTTVRKLFFFFFHFWTLVSIWNSDLISWIRFFFSLWWLIVTSDVISVYGLNVMLVFFISKTPFFSDFSNVVSLFRLCWIELILNASNFYSVRRIFLNLALFFIERALFILRRKAFAIKNSF